MHDSGVVPGLVRGHGRLLLEHHDRDPRARELARHRQPDDACTDDPDRGGVGDVRYHWYLTAAVVTLL